MIQRIQSIYLFLASLSCFGLAGLPLATTETAVTESSLFSDRLFTIFDNPILTGIVFTAAAIFFLTIFLFRNRLLQMRLSLFSVALLFGAAGLGGYLMGSDQAVERASIYIGAALPVLAIVFGVLARGGIQKDEKLVRSSDRLR